MRRQNCLHETGTVLRLGLRNALSRPLLPLIVVVGFLAVVLVMVSVLSIGRGLNRTYANSGETDVAMAISDGSLVESQSSLGEPEVAALASEPGVAAGGAGPMVSPELVDTVELPKQGSAVVSDVVLRGVTPNGYRLHPRVHLIAGRMYRSGVREVIVGRQASREYSGLGVGATLRSGGVDWTVTGIFASDGDIHESEIWTDLPGLQDALRQPDSYSSVYLKMRSPAGYMAFAAAVTRDPRLAVQLQREKSFYKNIAAGITGLFRGAAAVITILMAVGAVVGAVNLMYVSLAARLSDIATLRAVGFRRLPVLCAVLCEGLTFGLTGGVFGGLLAYAACDGYQAGTIFADGHTQVDFQFAVSAGLIGAGIAFALLMGLIGGLFPAIRAARLPLARALRS
ncbi:MAG TPA: ABC transporter permease [Steroidobacteraceae bacterium]|jgi:putative ABC transport system permease protein|nr:ABC transporter permease [Steroidobacteraceae bacterium]